MSSARARSISLIRLLCHLLSYTLFLTLLPPPTWTAVAESGSVARGFEKAATGTATITVQADAPRREGELLVRFSANVTDRGKDDIASSRGARRKGRLRGDSRAERLELRPGFDAAAVATQLRAQPGVELAEPNFLVRHDQTTPGDTRFPEQWALRNEGQSGGAVGSDVRAQAAWRETTGATATVIAVVDSGIDFTHPDLSNNRWVNPAEVADNGEDDDRDGYPDDVSGWDWVAGTGVVRDEQGHGTSVAGIIAAEGDNGLGVAGVMWRASLMSLRVLDSSGTGDVASAVEAIDFAVAHGAQVINCSWGTEADSQFLRDAIERAGRKGVVVVASAGNAGRDIDARPYYPASYDLPNLITVASSDGFDNLAPFSGWGASRVAVAAPGTNILTTHEGGDYHFVTGTSASVPIVSGIAGLIKTLRPSTNPRVVRSAILDGARKVNTLAGKVSSGGVADAAGALEALRGNPYAAGPENGGNGHGNANGRPYVPPALRHDRDRDRGRGRKGLMVKPPEAVSGAPGPNLPNLNESRKRRTSSTASAPSATIRADLMCADCDPSGAGGAGGYYPSDPHLGTARMRPANDTGDPGVDLGSRNFNWEVPLVSLKGRSGLDLAISLYYNSLVWTKQGTVIQYNADHGTPAPGFNIGLPRLQAQFFNSDVNANAYLMITPSGGRIEMRQTGTSGVYESVDSTYTQLTFSGSAPLVRTTDGMQYLFGAQVGGGTEWRCTQIKDRNGNYISAEYDLSTGHLLRIKDTLWVAGSNNRVVNFNYNADGTLDTITQTWGGATHTYAQFLYGSITMSLNLPGLAVVGTSNGASQTVLTSVVLSGTSGSSHLDSYNFDYNSYGQVFQIRHLAPDGHELGRTRYNMGNADLGASPQSDCPRFTQRAEWAETWNGDTDGTYSTAEEAVTTYTVTGGVTFTHPSTGEQMTGTLAQEVAPDGTTYKEYSRDTGWDAGLPQLSEIWTTENNVSVKKKWSCYVWTQDNTFLLFAQNPRMVETNIYDDAGNRKRTTIEYNQGFGLPTHVREWGGPNMQTCLRMYATVYNLDAAYTSRRIIGLVFRRETYDPNGLKARTEYFHDWSGDDSFRDTPAPATQHDRTNYGPSFVVGRGNLSDVARFSADDPSNANGTAQEIKYRVNSTGSVLMERDPLWHTTYTDYADSFSDGVNRNTFAYPTTTTDADGASSTIKYNYDSGSVARTHTPSSGTLPNNKTYADEVFTYDAFGRTERIERFDGQSFQGYRRFDYEPNDRYTHTYETLTGTTQADEYHSWEIADGAGRVRARASDHPGSTGGFSGQYFIYNELGRLTQQSNPTEIDENWNPIGDDVFNQSQNTGGWRYTLQTYDWQGRPRVTTNTDGTTKEYSYGGCGCAGGDVATEVDEHERQKRFTKDILGRLTKVEELNWSGAVYSTTQYAYNVLDKLTEINQQGQSRTFEYDGHGRLWRRTTPEQGTTTYTYHADDTTNVVTDARGATLTYGYNGRHQVTSVSHSAPPGSGVAATPNVSYMYDEAGHRFYMEDGEGYTFYNYDSHGRLEWEERNFTNIGTYRLSYEYNHAGQLKKITYPWQIGGAQVTYNYDKAGRLTSVGGAGYANVSTYVNSITYRAFGGVKGMSYSNAKTLSTSYDRRMRATKWDVSGVLGFKYYYDDFNERTGRVTFAQSIDQSTAHLDRAQTASSLDRSYEYDHLGRLIISHTGAEARAHAFSGQWGTMDGAYSHGYEYDQWGNMTHRFGWGGEVQGGGAGQSSDIFYTYATGSNGVVNNRRSDHGFTYDAAGNLTFDGGQHFTYDAQGHQVSVDWTNLQQGYDGDGLRVRRTENGASPIRYLRSSVLGGQVLAELANVNGSWLWQRGYVYSGGGLVAVQQAGVFFVHEDPVTKSKRLTSMSGAVQTATELDPFGADAGGLNTAFQPRKFATYERDLNGSDDAMFRRYNRWHSRFDQPDPYDGSYDLADPQSLNRYAYTRGDPVNLIDPKGLDFCWGETLIRDPWDVTPFPGTEPWRCGGDDGPVMPELPGDPPPSGGSPGGGVQALPNKSFIDRLKDCVKEIYGVDLTNFTSVTSGRHGVFQGTGYNRYTGHTGLIQVVTNASAYSSNQLRSMNNEYARRYPHKGQPVVQPGERVLGATFSFGMIGATQVSPYVNYLANNPPSSLSTDAAKQFLQVHELGHSLSDITGKGSGERGKQLEDCVFPKLPKLPSGKRR